MPGRISQALKDEEKKRQHQQELRESSSHFLRILPLLLMKTRFGHVSEMLK